MKRRAATNPIYWGTGVCAGQAHWQSTTLWKYCVPGWVGFIRRNSANEILRLRGREAGVFASEVAEPAPIGGAQHHYQREGDHSENKPGANEVACRERVRAVSHHVLRCVNNEDEAEAHHELQ